MDVQELNELTFLDVLSHAEEVLKRGGIVIATTDTVYGILGNAENKDTIQKVFDLKNRPNEKAFPVFVSDIEAAQKLADISDAKIAFLKHVWPGAVTAIFSNRGKLPGILTGGSETLGIRIPHHPFVLALLQKVSFPLLQTSANISAHPPAKNLVEIKNYFDQSTLQPDLVIDGGVVDGQSSTVIDFSGERPVVLREGSLAEETLKLLQTI